MQFGQVSISLVLFLLVEEAAQVLGAAGMPELSERFVFNLTDALASDVELPANLLERVVRVHVDAEAHA